MTGPLNADTAADIERLQIETWRQMSPAEKAAIVSGLTQASVEMAQAGIRDRYPDASPREHFLRLAILLLGDEIAAKAYPESAHLDAL